MNKPDYAQKLAFLWKWEGNIAARFKSDPGSLTNRGITYFTWQKLAPEVVGAPGTLTTFRKMNIAQWGKVVNYYWKVATLDNRVPSQAVSEWLHESLWVSGGIWPIQKAINQFFGKEKVEVSGRPNAETLAALKEAIAQDEARLVEEIYKQVVLRYKKIRYPDYHPKAGRLMYPDNPGWFKRSDELYSITLYKTQTQNVAAQWIIGYVYPFRRELGVLAGVALLAICVYFLAKKYYRKKESKTLKKRESFLKKANPTLA
jgi:lysozyme family protein